MNLLTGTENELSPLVFYGWLMFFAVPLLITLIYAPDLWKSLYAGRYMVYELSFPAHDTFTFSPASTYAVHYSYRWLGNLTLYGLHQSLGLIGLQLFKFCLVMGSIYLMHRIVEFDCSPAVLWLLILFLLGVLQKTLIKNPMFLIPFLTAFWYIWYKFRFRGALKWGFLLPVLVMIWGNMHASYLIGVGIFGILIAGEWISVMLKLEVRLQLERVLIATGLWVICLLVAYFIKPNVDPVIDLFVKQVITGFSQLLCVGGGTSGGAEFIKSVLMFAEPGSGEQTSILTEGLVSPLNKFQAVYVKVAYFVTALIVVLWVIRPEKIRVSFLFVIGTVTVLGSLMLRSVALVPLTIVPLILMKYRLGDFHGLSVGDNFKLVCMIGLFLFTALFTYQLSYHRMPRFLGMSSQVPGWGKHWKFSDRLPDYVLENHRRTKIYNTYAIGSYLIWKWWPKKKVFVDTRSGAYQADFIRRILQDKSQFVRDLSFEYALISAEKPVSYYYFIPDSGWRLEAYDEGMFLFRSQGTQLTATNMPSLLYDLNSFQKLSLYKQNRLKVVSEFIRLFGNKDQFVGQFPGPKWGIRLHNNLSAN